MLLVGWGLGVGAEVVGSGEVELAGWSLVFSLCG